MDLYPPAPPPTPASGLPDVAYLGTRPPKRRKPARSEPANAGLVRDVDSNGQANASAGGNHRTSDDHRRWITPHEDRFWHSHWAARRQKILTGMEHAGYPEARIERFVNCGSFTHLVEDADTGEMRARASHCHDRFCSRCCKAKSLLIADNLATRIKEERCSYLHIVLTTKHNRRPLAEQVTTIYANFKKLRRRPLFRNHVDGGAAFLQIHVADADGLWHVHLHLLGRGKWLDALALSTEWLTVTGDSNNVSVTAVINADAAVREVTRYAAKPVDGETTNDPERLAEIMRALTGRRLCFTFGKWRRYKLTAKPAIDPTKRFIEHGALSSVIARAQAGEEHAKHLLRIIWTRANPKTGPPDLFADAWWST